MALMFRLDVDQLRSAIQEEYADVAACPTKGFHFHTGRPLAGMLGYDPAEVDRLPGRVVGVDMTLAMLAKARANAALVGAGNTEFREGFAEALPVPDATADVV